MVKKEIRFCELEGNGKGVGGKPETRLRLFHYETSIQYRIGKGVFCLHSGMYKIRSSLNDVTVNCCCCLSPYCIRTVGVDMMSLLTAVVA